MPSCLAPANALRAVYAHLAHSKFVKQAAANVSSGLRQVHASLIVVLTRGGSTARLVAKYRPAIPVLTVAVPVLTTDSLTWTCSGEQPARQCLVTRGLLPLLAQGSARASDSDTTDEILLVPHTCLMQKKAGNTQCNSGLAEQSPPAQHMQKCPVLVVRHAHIQHDSACAC